MLVDELTRRIGDHVALNAPAQGLHLVGRLLNGLSDVDVEAAAKARGVVVRSTRRCYLKARPRPAIMLGFSGYPAHQLIPAAARLTAVIQALSRLQRRRHVN
jgi:GntR family transcriptional regulator/MocR family aminotransferase